MVSRPVSFGVKIHLGPNARSVLLSVAGLLMWGTLSDERTGLSFVIWCWSSPAQSFSGPSPLGLTTIFYCLRLPTSLFVSSYDSRGHDGGIWPRLHPGGSLIAFSSQSQSYVTTDGHSASLSWNKAPIWVLRPDLCYCQTFAGLFVWGALSDERTDLSFTTFADPRQRSHSQVRVPWHSLPYFTVSNSRHPFSSSPTTCRVTVEVFDPASTRGWLHSHLSFLLYSVSVSMETCLSTRSLAISLNVTMRLFSHKQWTLTLKSKADHWWPSDHEILKN
jgi:hypothetical protein